MFGCIALPVSFVYAINVVWYRHLSIESKKYKNIFRSGKYEVALNFEVGFSIRDSNVLNCNKSGQ